MNRGFNPIEELYRALSIAKGERKIDERLRPAVEYLINARNVEIDALPTDLQVEFSSIRGRLAFGSVEVDREPAMNVVMRNLSEQQASQLANRIVTLYEKARQIQYI